MSAAAPHLVCTAQRPGGSPPFDPRWRTEAVMALTRGITADWAFDRMPILADALEEAGCDDPAVLHHLRHCHHHTAHCWVLGDLFDRPPVPAPRRLTEEQVRREVEFITGRRLEPAHGSGGRVSGRSALLSVWKLGPALVVVGVVMFVKLFFVTGSYRPATIPTFRASPPVQFPTPAPGQFDNR
jgi:hypothetical protein